MITTTKQLKYQEISKEIEEYLAQTPSGEKLPSDRELARRFGCNALTVRKAFEPFVEDGVIVRRVGSGTFKCDDGVDNKGSVTPSLSKIGMLIHFRSDEYAMQVIKNSLEIAEKKSLELRFSYITDYGISAVKEAENMAREGCSALIIPWFPSELTGDVAHFIHACALPVSIPMLIPGLEKNCFEKAEVFGKGTIGQTEGFCHYFQLLGNQKIALLGPNAPANSIMQQRLGAYSNFIYSNELEHLCGLVGDGVEEMDDLARKWAAYKGQLAVICHDDLYAIRFMTAMRKLGLSAPDDFSIVGCNNSREAAFSDPPLSSMHDDYAYCGEWLIRRAQALAKGSNEQSSEMPNHYLIVRSSCGGKDNLSPEILDKLNQVGVEVINENKI